MRLLRRALVAGALALSMAAGPTTAADPTPAPTQTPIHHAIFLMQEGHSFDNLFGVYPGVDGIPPGTCVLVDPSVVASGCAAPLWVGDRVVPQLDQSSNAFGTQFDGGKMDGFVAAQADAGADARLTMGYYDDREVPFGWNVADAFVLLDRYFGSAKGGSAANHMYWISGAKGSPTDALPPAGYGNLPTVFDRLQAAGVSWKFYVQNYDPSITFRNKQGLIDRGTQVERVPLLAFARFVDNAALFGHIVDLSQYYTDLEQGTLPAVSYIVPAGGGAHTPSSVHTEQLLAGSLIGGLARSAAWSSSMLLWTYDNSGGWYDHVTPPQVDADGLGFRVPALLVSPYARKGYVDKTQLDHTAAVHFITTNWGLQPLAARDKASASLMGGLDFANPGRPPLFVGSTRPGTGVHKEPQRSIIFLAYGSALALAVVLITVAALRTRRGRAADQGRAADHARKDRE